MKGENTMKKLPEVNASFADLYGMLIASIRVQIGAVTHAGNRLGTDGSGCRAEGTDTGR